MSAATMAEGEVRREARRIFRLLAAGKGCVMPADGGAYDVLKCVRNGMRRAMRVEGATIDVFLRRGWIVRNTDGAYVLSEAGLYWLRCEGAAGDPFLVQHRLEREATIKGADGEPQTVLVNDGESPLGWLFRRRGADGKALITKRQFEAGEQLRTDFTLSNLTPRLGVDLTAPVVAGRRGAKPSDLPLTVIGAKQRYSRALEAVGPGLSGILVDVCCHLIGLAETERQMGWPVRSGKVVLQIALDRLADHYGMGSVTGTGRAMRVWQAPENADAS
mgnify:CR=1 FL=1